MLGVTGGLHLVCRKFPEWGFFHSGIARSSRQEPEARRRHLEHLDPCSMLRSFSPLWKHAALSSSGEMDIKYLFLKVVQEETDDSCENNP